MNQNGHRYGQRASDGVVGFLRANIVVLAGGLLTAAGFAVEIGMQAQAIRDSVAQLTTTENRLWVKVDAQNAQLQALSMVPAQVQDLQIEQRRTEARLDTLVQWGTGALPPAKTPSNER